MDYSKYLFIFKNRKAERLSYGMGKPGTKICKLVNCSIYGSDTYEEKESYG